MSVFARIARQKRPFSTRIFRNAMPLFRDARGLWKQPVLDPNGVEHTWFVRAEDYNSSVFATVKKPKMDAGRGTEVSSIERGER